MEAIRVHVLSSDPAMPFDDWHHMADNEYNYVLFVSKEMYITLPLKLHKNICAIERITFQIKYIAWNCWVNIAAMNWKARKSLVIRPPDQDVKPLLPEHTARTVIAGLDLWYDQWDAFFCSFSPISGNALEKIRLPDRRMPRAISFSANEARKSSVRCLQLYLVDPHSACVTVTSCWGTYIYLRRKWCAPF
jgi:hypothetical protein